MQEVIHRPVNSDELSSLRATLEDYVRKCQQLEEANQGLCQELDEVRAEKDDALRFAADNAKREETPKKNDMSLSSTYEDDEDRLREAEEKISQLLKVKERYSELTGEKSVLETSLVELEKEVETLSLQSQLSTACSVFPLALLVVAVIVAYLPMLASLFGTADQ